MVLYPYGSLQLQHYVEYTPLYILWVMYIADFVIEPDGLNKVAQKVEHNLYRIILNN